MAWDGSIEEPDDVVKIRRFKANGEPDGKPISVVETRKIFEPSVAVIETGEVAVVWRKKGDIVGQDVRGVMSLDTRDVDRGVATVAANNLGNLVLSGSRALLVMDADGDSLVSWIDESPISNSLNQLRAQRYRGREAVDVQVQYEGAATPIATANARFGYSLTATNAHPPNDSAANNLIADAIGTATDVKISATVPLGAQLPVAAGESWSCVSSVAAVNCDYLLAVPPAETTLPLRLEYSAPSTPAMLTHRVRVKAAQRDLVRSNNRATQQTNVVCGPVTQPKACAAAAPGLPVLEFASLEANGREKTCKQDERDCGIELNVKLTGSGGPASGVCFSLLDGGSGTAQEGVDFYFVPPVASGDVGDPCAIGRRIASPTFTVPPASDPSGVTVALLCLPDDQRIEKAEQVVFELAGSDDYQCGEQKTFAVTIRDPGK